MSPRLVIAAVLGLAAFNLPFCAARPPSVGSVRDAVGDARDVQRAAEKLEAKKKKCDALRGLKVAYEEERTLGGAVALSFIGQSKGLLVDVPANADVNALKDPAKVNLSRTTPRYQAHAYLNRVGKNLAARSSRPGLNWTFGIIDSPAVNAYSAPGGYVLVTTGLLKLIDNEAQLAGVLGHEIGHVTEQHALKLYSEIKANQCSAAMAVDVAGDVVKSQATFTAAIDTPGGYVNLNLPDASGVLTKLTDGVVEKITSLGYAESDEYDSDRVGIDLMIAAGYSPKEFVRFLAKLPDGGGAFAHHPKNTDRQKKLDGHVAGQKPQPGTFGNGDWPYDKYPAVALRSELKAVK